MESVESKCSFCRKDYDSDSHIPLALVCGHSYGRSCAVLNYRRNMMRCCECGEIEERDPNSIPVNYSLREIMEFRGRQIMDKEMILRSLYEKIGYYEYKEKADSDLVTLCIKQNTQIYRSCIEMFVNYINLLNDIKLNFEKTFKSEQISISENTIKYKETLKSNISNLKSCVETIKRSDNHSQIQSYYEATMKLIQSKSTETKLELKKLQAPSIESILSEPISNLVTSFDWNSDKITIYLDNPSNPIMPAAPVVPPIKSDPSSPQISDPIPAENRSPVQGYLSVFHQRHSK